MTLAGATTRVRHLINQTSSSNTLFDDTNFIANVLNQGRRMFASILPEERVPKLRIYAPWTVTANVAAHPSNFLKEAMNPNTNITVGGGVFIARKIPIDEMWRFRIIRPNSVYVSDILDEYYFYERSDGIYFPTSDTISMCVRDYIKVPTDLSTTDNVELPGDLDDQVVDFAFRRCMGTTRGDRELALYLLKEAQVAV